MIDSDLVRREMVRLLGENTTPVRGRRDTFGFELRNGRAVPAEAVVDGDWLRLRTSPLDVEHTQIGQLLHWNHLAHGGAKFASLGAANEISLAAELPANERDLPELLEASVSGLRTALQALHSGKWPGRQAAPGELGDTLHPDLAELLAGTEWRSSLRADGRAVVDLTMPNQFRQAKATILADGGLLLSTRIARCDQLSPACRRAVEMLLMRASGLFSMVRGVIVQSGGQHTCGFEVALLGDSGSATVAHGLRAMWLACKHCGRELEALSEESVAQQYLAAAASTTFRPIAADERR